MRLCVTDRTDNAEIDKHIISIDNFNDLCYHPYIQSITWESVIIDMDDRITRSYIKQLLGRSIKVVPRILKDSVTPKQLLLLGEIYPDNISEIFSWSKLSRNEMMAKVHELAELHNWKLEY